MPPTSKTVRQLAEIIGYFLQFFPHVIHALHYTTKHTEKKATVGVHMQGRRQEKAASRLTIGQEFEFRPYPL
ncbi:MAG: hypothetical protein HYT41_02250 [Candidatus Sungbacteria bacterium]|nr:hypothetical protein [Candidatus Sungbacteria bacterium]